MYTQSVCLVTSQMTGKTIPRRLLVTVTVNLNNNFGQHFQYWPLASDFGTLHQSSST